MNEYHSMGRAWCEANYDPAAKLLRFDRFLKAWKPTANLHMTRDSLYFGRILLDSADPAEVPRSEAIIQAVLDTQVKREGSPARGNYPWGAEDAENEIWDPNWGCFNAQTLIEILHWHGSRLSPGLSADILTALRLSNEHDLKRWVSPAYTNIGLLTAHALACGGDLLGDKAYSAAGRRKLKEVRDCVAATGAFDEYNSPTYAAVNLRTLATLLMFLPPDDEEPLAIVRDLWAKLWKSLLSKLHRPSGQLAGPHGRAYGRDMLRHTHGLVKFCLHRSLGSDWPLGVKADGTTSDLFPALLIHDPFCPPELVAAWKASSLPRTEAEVVDSALPSGILELRIHPAFWRARRGPEEWAQLIANKGHADEPGFKGPIQKSTTWLGKKFCMGSINGESMGDQSVPLIAHWPQPGRDDRANYVAALALKRDKDKLANLGGGVLCLAQQEGRALGLMRFEREEAWPGDERFTPAAPEVMLAFQFNADAAPQPAAGSLDLAGLSRGVVIRSQGILVGLRVLGHGLAGAEAAVAWEQGTAPHGPREGEWGLHFSLKPLKVEVGQEAWVAFALELASEEDTTTATVLGRLAQASVKQEEGEATLNWENFGLQTSTRVMDARSFMTPEGKVKRLG